MDYHILPTTGVTLMVCRFQDILGPLLVDGGDYGYLYVFGNRLLLQLLVENHQLMGCDLILDWLDYSRVEIIGTCKFVSLEDFDFCYHFCDCVDDIQRMHSPTPNWWFRNWIITRLGKYSCKVVGSRYGVSSVYVALACGGNLSFIIVLCNPNQLFHYPAWFLVVYSQYF